MPETGHLNPAALLDAVLYLKQLHTDAGLCRLLGVSAPYLSRVRNGRQPVGASMLLRLHEETGLSIKDLRALMGDRQPRFTPSARGFSRVPN